MHGRVLGLRGSRPDFEAGGLVNDLVATADLPEPLTDRERTILRLLAGGYSNHEIAELLNITEGTVKNHLKSAVEVGSARSNARGVACDRLRRDLRDDTPAANG